MSAWDVRSTYHGSGSVSGRMVPVRPPTSSSPSVVTTVTVGSPTSTTRHRQEMTSTVILVLDDYPNYQTERAKNLPPFHHRLLLPSTMLYCQVPPTTYRFAVG